MAESIRWCSVGGGLLVLLALLAIAGPGDRESQLGQLGSGAGRGFQTLPIKPGPRSANLPATRPPSTAVPDSARERAANAYRKMPLAFVRNAGQIDAPVRYYAQGAGFAFYFTDDEAVLVLEKGGRGQALHLRFLGANPDAELTATDRGTGKVNYFSGSERHTNLPTYERLTYRDLWPGVDMVFQGAGGKLKYEFRLRPGATVSDIRLAYRGAESVSLGPGGALLVDTPLGTLRDARPQSFQRIDGRRVPVDSRYALAGDSYGFAVGAHDRNRPLVIDPSLVYSTYLGGSSFKDEGWDIAVDSAGAAYVAGDTNSADFPTTAGAFDTSHNGTADAFVTKLNPGGSSLAYSTYLGGSSNDEGRGIAVDEAGSAYVNGRTESGDFPTTLRAFDTSQNGSADTFVAKLDPAGSGLAYSTYLGGSSFDDAAYGVAVDSTGAVYATGNTSSTDFPTTPGAFAASRKGPSDAFVTKLNPAGSTLGYSTYLGGSEGDAAHGVAVDSTGAAYVTGVTDSGDFPTTAGAFDSSYNGLGDAFVTKLNPLGSGLGYSTYLGGSSDETGSGIAVDSAGAAYATGFTSSPDFPTTVGAFDASVEFFDAFITKLNPLGSGLAYSTYLGGSFAESGLHIAVDSAGVVYVNGATGSTNFPTTAGAFDTTYNGGTDMLPSDAFVTKLNPAGSGLLYSTYLGGSGNDFGTGIAVNAAGSLWATGITESGDFPTTTGAFDTSFNGTSSGSRDAFVTKLSTAAGPGPPATLTLAPKSARNTVGTRHCVTATVRDASGNPTLNRVVRFRVRGSVTRSGSATTDQRGKATFCYRGPELPGSDTIRAFADSDEDNTQDPGEPADTATKTWVLPPTTPGCEIRITDGGRITANNGDSATFGGNAIASADGELQGQQVYRDRGPAANLNVKSTSELALVCSADRKRATIFGEATINGTGSFSYKIEVQDLNEPGVDIDTYRILLSSGYDSGRHTLEAGNIQIHSS